MITQGNRTAMYTRRAPSPKVGYRGNGWLRAEYAKEREVAGVAESLQVLFAKLFLLCFLLEEFTILLFARVSPAWHYFCFVRTMELVVLTVVQA